MLKWKAGNFIPFRVCPNRFRWKIPRGLQPWLFWLPLNPHHLAPCLALSIVSLENKAVAWYLSPCVMPAGLHSCTERLLNAYCVPKTVTDSGGVRMKRQTHSMSSGTDFLVWGMHKGHRSKFKYGSWRGKHGGKIKPDKEEMEFGDRELISQKRLLKVLRICMGEHQCGGSEGENVCWKVI